jgi:hypothetical protein
VPAGQVQVHFVYDKSHASLFVSWTALVLLLIVLPLARVWAGLRGVEA